MKLKRLVKKERDTDYLLFAGKGGVGKTSMAAATAFSLSKKGSKTLIISTDPAHSLSDSYEKRIGAEIVEVKKNLFAVEIDPRKAMAEYKEKFMPQIEKIQSLQSLGLGDTFDMMGMTPGIDELAAIDKFMFYMQSKEYDCIIFDTAPTGHTLRFLSLPDVLDSWVGKMIMFKMKFSGVTSLVKKILPFAQDDEGPDKSLEQLKAMKSRVEEAKRILTDPEKTKYNIVLIPEEMSILESLRSLEALGQYGIPVKDIIVNQVIPENPRCHFCKAKRQQQQKRLKVIHEKFHKFEIKEVELFKEEVKGLYMLDRVGKGLV